MRFFDENHKPVRAVVQFEYRGHLISATSLRGLSEIGIFTPSNRLLEESFPATAEGFAAAMRRIDGHK